MTTDESRKYTLIQESHTHVIFQAALDFIKLHNEYKQNCAAIRYCHTWKLMSTQARKMQIDSIKVPNEIQVPNEMSKQAPCRREPKTIGSCIVVSYVRKWVTWSLHPSGRHLGTNCRKSKMRFFTIFESMWLPRSRSPNSAATHCQTLRRLSPPKPPNGYGISVYPTVRLMRRWYTPMSFPFSIIWN